MHLSKELAECPKIEKILAVLAVRSAYSPT